MIRLVLKYKEVKNMGKILVTYFSVSGATKEVAKRVADIAKADLYEIEPEVKYTNNDIDWRNKKSRASLENEDPNVRPNLKKKDINIKEYDTVFIGFPVWWNVEPRVVDSFIDENDFTGKKIVAFATSGGSSIDGSLARLKTVIKGSPEFGKGRIIALQDSDDTIKTWIDGEIN